jgi:arsenate reductase-like glutaredoxin family protein
MPAPSPATDGVQVFGLDDSPATRAAQRFFRERRIAIHYVDLDRRPIARAELRRFTDRLGARGVADTDGRAWRDAGLDYLRMDDAELADRLLADQRLLLLPLVRCGGVLVAGRNEAGWREAARAASPAAAAGRG